MEEQYAIVEQGETYRVYRMNAEDAKSSLLAGKLRRLDVLDSENLPVLNLAYDPCGDGTWLVSGKESYSLNDLV